MHGPETIGPGAMESGISTLGAMSSQAMKQQQPQLGGTMPQQQMRQCKYSTH